MGFSYMKQGSLSPGDLDALVSALQLAQELPFPFCANEKFDCFSKSNEAQNVPSHNEMYVGALSTLIV